MQHLFIATLLMLCSACTTAMPLASHGSWDGATELGPVKACRGGSLSYDPPCNNWPMSVSTMPPPDTHYMELTTQAATQYQVDPAAVVLKDVRVEYSTEINGVIRGWKAYATAGRRP